MTTNRKDEICSLGCVNCNAQDESVVWHHLIDVPECQRGMGKKCDDKYTIPLCVKCHNEVHNHEWKDHVQRQRDLLEHTNRLLKVWKSII